MRLAFLAALPIALAATPAARWGQQAVYVESKSAVYIVGGEISASGTQITNDVLILPLNQTNPSFEYGSADALPPHAFASMALTKDESTLVVTGGMTSSCDSDPLVHSYDLNSGSWSSTTPSGMLRRRGATSTWVDNGSSGAVMVVGGIVDSYVCSASTYAYPAADVLSLPMSTGSLVSTRNLPTSLTGTNLAVAEYAMTSINGNIYLAGGQTAAGDLVALSTIGVWTSASGWTSQTTTGDLPAPRIGASLVAHPSLDLLILHGGATYDGSSDTATALLAFLNTTTWTWSTPSNLQPPTSSARSYHSSVITPQGVMITAFGLAASGDPRSDIFYLDMRDPSTSAWTWKSMWSNSMLTAVTASNTVVTSASPSATGVVAAVTSAPSKKTITTIVVPIVVVLLLLLPIIIYLVRRRLRLIKKRRMARHFSFSSQEDSGDFRKPLMLSKSNQSLFGGRDANEREGSIMSSVGAGLVSILKRYSGSSEQDVKPKKINEKVNWEEIDFGLGKLDESKSRRSSFSATNSPEHQVSDAMPFPMPVASTFDGGVMTAPLIVTYDESPRVGSPRNDGQLPLIPSLVVMPPTGPPTPATYPTASPTYPAMSNDGLDWNMLQQELEAKPAFRSISPTSTLRSHQHVSPPVNRAPSPSGRSTPPASPAHHLPPLDFQRSVSPSGSIILVNPKTGRRTSETSLPFTPRAASQPMAGRQLTYGERRGSVPSIHIPSPPTDLAERRTSGPPAMSAFRSPIDQARRASGQSRLRVTNPTEDDSESDASSFRGQAF